MSSILKEFKNHVLLIFEPLFHFQLFYLHFQQFILNLWTNVLLILNLVLRSLFSNPIAFNWTLSTQGYLIKSLSSSKNQDFIPITHDVIHFCMAASWEFFEYVQHLFQGYTQWCLSYDPQSLQCCKLSPPFQLYLNCFPKFSWLLDSICWNQLASHQDQQCSQIF